MNVDELNGEMTGKWLVTTQGSTHVWDLDNGTYQRRPGPGRSAFDYDEEVVKITRVGRWPKVGDVSLVYYDDLKFPDTKEQWRQSSTIKSIEKIESESSGKTKR